MEKIKKNKVKCTAQWKPLRLFAPYTYGTASAMPAYGPYCQHYQSAPFGRSYSKHSFFYGSSFFHIFRISIHHWLILASERVSDHTIDKNRYTRKESCDRKPVPLVECNSFSVCFTWPNESVTFSYVLDFVVVACWFLHSHQDCYSRTSIILKDYE